MSLDAHGVVDPNPLCRSVVESRAYLLENRDEITASGSPPKPGRRVAFADIRSSPTISRPPPGWTPDIIWTAYRAVDVGKVKHSDRRTLTDLVSLLRYTVGLDDELVPLRRRVQKRYAAWLAQQAQAGSDFSALERWWLDRMVDVIASSPESPPTTSTARPSPTRAASTEPCATLATAPAPSSTS